MDVKGKRVFLSGPMTGRESLNVAEFAKAHAIVKEAGASCAYDPAIEYLTSDCVADAHTHAWWMTRCIRELVREYAQTTLYDVLVLLPGWESSEGSRTERTVAEACGIEVCELKDVVPCG